MIQILLEELAEGGYLTEVSRGKYKMLSRGSTVEGTVDMTASGAAYIITEDDGPDIFIPRAKMNQALHGDVVKVFQSAKRRNRQPEGEIIEIIKRKRDLFVGVMQIAKGLAFLVVDRNNFV